MYAGSASTQTVLSSQPRSGGDDDDDDDVAGRRHPPVQGTAAAQAMGLRGLRLLSSLVLPLPLPLPCGSASPSSNSTATTLRSSLSIACSSRVSANRGMPRSHFAVEPAVLLCEVEKAWLTRCMRAVERAALHFTSDDVYRVGVEIGECGTATAAAAAGGRIVMVGDVRFTRHVGELLFFTFLLFYFLHTLSDDNRRSGKLKAYLRE